MIVLYMVRMRCGKFFVLDANSHCSNVIPPLKKGWTPYFFLKCRYYKSCDMDESTEEIRVSLEILFLTAYAL